MHASAVGEWQSAQVQRDLIHLIDAPHSHQPATCLHAWPRWSNSLQQLRRGLAFGLPITSCIPEASAENQAR